MNPGGWKLADGSPRKVYSGARYCSHDGGATWHREHWACWLRTAILRERNPQPSVFVSSVDPANGVFTLTTKAGE